MPLDRMRAAACHMLVLEGPTTLRSLLREHSEAGTPRARNTISVQANPQSQLKDCRTCGTVRIERFCKGISICMAALSRICIAAAVVRTTAAT